MPDLNDYKATLIEQLERYKAADTTEAQYVYRLLNFIISSPSPFSRQNDEGHITVSAILTDQTMSHVLLIWHNKLQRWLQPGGHCENDLDQSTQAGSFRELLEETSFNAKIITLAQELPFDIDIHLIPATGSEKAHIHYDIRYLYISQTAETISESPHLQWKRVEEVALYDECMARFAKKLMLMRQR